MSIISDIIENKVICEISIISDSIENIVICEISIISDIYLITPESDADNSFK